MITVNLKSINLGRAHTESTRHESTRSPVSTSPLPHPGKKSYQMYGGRAHWFDATHTYMEKDVNSSHLTSIIDNST